MPTILAIMFVLFGSMMLWWLPRYKRKVDLGQTQLDPAMPSFKVMRRVAIGLIVFGVLAFVAQYFVRLEF